MTKHPKLHLGQSIAFAILAISALFMVASQAKAADAPPPETQSFLKLDINMDGYVDKKEAVASPALIKIFDSADTDKDGRLTPAEYAKAFSMKPKAAAG